VQIDTPRRRRTAIRLAPLIDVVFILLVFFMLASSFLDWRAFEVGLPEPKAGGDPDSTTVVVTVDAAGEFRVAGEAVAASNLAAAVRAAWEGSDAPVVSLQPDPEAPVKGTMTAFDRLRGGGIEQVSLDGAQP